MNFDGTQIASRPRNSSRRNFSELTKRSVCESAGDPDDALICANGATSQSVRAGAGLILFLSYLCYHFSFQLQLFLMILIYAFLLLWFTGTESGIGVHGENQLQPHSSQSEHAESIDTAAKSINIPIQSGISSTGGDSPTQQGTGQSISILSIARRLGALGIPYNFMPGTRRE